MKPTIETYVRQKAVAAGVYFEFELTDEMKKWSNNDWLQFKYERDAQVRNVKQQLEEERARAWQVERLTKACGDIEMAEDIANGGIHAFQLWAPRMSLEQFTKLGFIVFNCAPRG